VTDASPTADEQPMLFASADLPRAAVPAAEWSQEWADARMLKVVEAVRFDPARLAAYEAGLREMGFEPGHPTGFLDFVIAQVGGRSQ
jgi:hypothetical protein